ncbi:MAG: hypothetical protein A2527_11010 [Candidatus Lambdaproteobacteria bacterium RIFOXYD2_FULL_50_16]|uniref:Methyltransferase domain-containing protein n=1 Tax=Candidatus Lambdaproteobacteria bacterium RIFOXYD2_FULL_50_16 TaxID=1817772 RepID=A0A1F6G6A7_9PROT|nr:MAG: hypothetical protein A2527_11010 [Candidatus Lambdaproteobacteria bacterium RIFOXYD2_FULL_50_16]
MSRIAEAFGQAALHYEESARLQRQSSFRLGELLDLWEIKPPEGPILEIGAGTGLVSRQLAARWAQRDLTFTDIAPEMVAQCRFNIGHTNIFGFATLDACRPLPGGPYATVVCALCLQWLPELKRILNHWIESLVPGGYLILTFPGAGSFKQWQEACDALGLPFLANPLPDGERIQAYFESLGGTFFWEDQTITLEYSKAADFFKELKLIGAATSSAGERLNPPEMKRLLAYLDLQPMRMSHLVHYLAYQKS